MARCPDILWTTEYIKHVLYFSIVKEGKTIRNTSDVHYFSIDNELVYENYYCDFGPLNLGCVYMYCKILNDKLKQYLNKQTIVHYTSNNPKKKANAAFLLGCYGVLYLSLTPKDAIKPLLAQRQCYRSFQDATQGDPTFTISILDCLQGIKKAHERGLFSFQDFDYEEYQRLDKIQGGDLNWIVPGKFLAFIGPVDLNLSLYHPPEMYIDYFLENDVQIVMRLNKKQYNANVFTVAGITHYDLYFADGSCPPRHILMKFLAISEDCTRGAIAVHCKAGLGRTGSLIGCYLIKHYQMSAREAISWMRICRPGSVIGQQQAWLEQLEPWLLKQGNLYRKRMQGDIDKMPMHKFGIYSVAEKNLKHRPVIYKKSPSPPPPMQRKEQLLLSPAMRPHASKVREAPSKASENDQSEWKMSTLRNTVKRNMQIQNCERANSSSGTSRRSSGAGDLSLPSTPQTESRTHITTHIPHTSTTKNSKTKATVNYPPITIFTTSQGPTIKTISDAKKFLLKTSTYAEQRQKQFKLNTECPQYSFGVPKFNAKVSTSDNADNSRYKAGNVAYMNYSGCITEKRDVNRRRLGRSPSPAHQMRSVVVAEQSRATNTPSGRQRNINKIPSKMVLKEEHSRLKVGPPRENSVGAASLGARRAAPAPHVLRAPTVRSDERPVATQGDLLNSVKFQRRLLNTMDLHKFNVTSNNSKPSLAPKEKMSIKTLNSRTINKPRVGSQVYTSNDKMPGNSSRSAFSPLRPSSPRARRTPPV